MKKFTVEEDGEIRLDRYIRRKLSYLSQSVIEKALRKGYIKVNTRKAESRQRVVKGDVITVCNNVYLKLNLNETAPTNYFSPNVVLLAHKLLNEYLILSCEHFIAINKPYNLAVQGGSKINISINDALLYLNKTTYSDYRLVHRLDKNTSGVLIIAKNLSSCHLLGQAFKEKILKKTYLAVTKKANDDCLTGVIENYLAKDKSGAYEIVKETKDGKFAKTWYAILASNEDISVIKFTPLTGRMHQLRVHSNKIGCPILGDTKYEGKKFARLMLHALSLEIPKNVFDKKYLINAPLDKFWLPFLNQTGVNIK